MQVKIKEALKNIEKDHNVRILYACESGSRAWGMPSSDSDFDVRFIYIHHPNWYLSIDEKKDVIELPVNALLDLSGWDIRKALKLFRKSNPSLQEWLCSDIVYEQNTAFINQLKAMSKEVFSPVVCLHHYLRMARRNYRDMLQGEQAKVKTYLHVIRPVLAGKWIAKYHTIPPILFQDLMEGLIKEGHLKREIAKLLAAKMKGEALNSGNRIDMINHFIEDEMEQLELFVKSVKHDPIDPTSRLDQLFRETLLEIWN